MRRFRKPKQSSGHKALEAQGGYRMWRKCRAMFLAGEPLCRRCKEAGRIRVATTVHHQQKAALNPSRVLDHSNLEPLCQQCHSQEHATETAHILENRRS